MQTCPTCKGIRFPKQYDGANYSEEARKLSLKVLFHLQGNNYEGAISILQKAEAKFLDTSNAQLEAREELKCVANLPIPCRLTEALDREGYIYVSDLDGVDIDKLCIPNLAEKSKAAIKQALKEVRQKLARV